MVDIRSPSPLLLLPGPVAKERYQRVSLGLGSRSFGFASRTVGSRTRGAV